MKNVLVCKNCASENTFYNFVCTKCNAILRERVVNIDLWHTQNLLLDSPGKAFLKIIQAEHKNFIFFLGFLIALKVFISSIILSEQMFNTSGSILLLLFLSLGAVPVFIIIASYLLKYSLKPFHVKTRFNDDYSIVTYSFIPYIYALVFLFPVEVTLFGEYLFSNNPSPFELKLIPAYVLAGLESLMALWSIVLLFFAAKTASHSNIYSIIYSLLIGLLFFLLPFAIPFIHH